MENSTHNIIVGSGAKSYAKENGFLLEENKSLLLPESDQVCIVMCRTLEAIIL